MKEATGELSTTVIAIVAIAAIAGLFTVFLLPMLRANIVLGQACGNGVGYAQDSCEGEGETCKKGYKVTYKTGREEKELNTKYALELNDLTLRAHKFIDEKTIVFDEFDDMAVVKFFDLWKGSFPCKVTLTLYDSVMKNKTYEKEYDCWLKMRPLTLDQCSDEPLKIYADLV